MLKECQGNLINSYRNSFKLKAIILLLAHHESKSHWNPVMKTTILFAFKKCYMGLIVIACLIDIKQETIKSF